MVDGFESIEVRFIFRKSHLGLGAKKLKPNPNLISSVSIGLTS